MLFYSSKISDKNIKKVFDTDQIILVFLSKNNVYLHLPTRPSSTYGSMGKLLRGKKFIYQDFAELVSTFMRQTYELDKVRIPTD